MVNTDDFSINPLSLPVYINGQLFNKKVTNKKNVDLYGNPIKSEKKNKIPFENAYN